MEKVPTDDEDRPQQVGPASGHSRRLHEQLMRGGVCVARACGVWGGRAALRLPPCSAPRSACLWPPCLRTRRSLPCLCTLLPACLPCLPCLPACLHSSASLPCPASAGHSHHRRHRVCEPLQGAAGGGGEGGGSQAQAGGVPGSAGRRWRGVCRSGGGDSGSPRPGATNKAVPSPSSCPCFLVARAITQPFCLPLLGTCRPRRRSRALLRMTSLGGGGPTRRLRARAVAAWGVTSPPSLGLLLLHQRPCQRQRRGGRRPRRPRRAAAALETLTPGDPCLLLCLATCCPPGLLPPQPVSLLPRCLLAAPLSPSARCALPASPQTF